MNFGVETYTCTTSPTKTLALIILVDREKETGDIPQESQMDQIRYPQYRCPYIKMSPKPNEMHLFTKSKYTTQLPAKMS